MTICSKRCTRFKQLSSKFHSSSLDEVLETLRMVEVEHLDIRTVTLGISLFDLAGSDARLPERIYDRITSLGANLVEIVTAFNPILVSPSSTSAFSDADRIDCTR